MSIRRPSACSQPEISSSTQDCRICRISAPTTTPQTLPIPPKTTITRIITDTGNMNMSGVAVCNLAMKRVPVAPAKAAPVAKARSLRRTRLMPIADAAISSSRIAIQARPMRESFSLTLTMIKRATSATAT